MVLLKKMFRDMAKNKMQFLTIFLMVLLSVLVFSGIDTVRQGISNNSNALYEATNISDLWVYTKGFTVDQQKEIEGIFGVEAVEGRFEAPLPFDDGGLTLFSAEDNVISKPYVVEGVPYGDDARGIWLDQEFVKANGYAVGDTIELAGKPLTIEGIILSGEKIYNPSPDSVVANYEKYGYGYVLPSTLESLLGRYQENVLVFKLASEVDTKEIQNQVAAILGDDYLMTLDKNSQISMKSLNTKLDQLSKFTYIFPALFFALALLTMLTTMTRIISNQRVQIGTLMSCGYSNGKIRAHYLAYGFWLSLFGGLGGVAAGYYLIPAIIEPVFKKMYILPSWDHSLTLGSFGAVLIILGLCLVVILISVGRKLKRMPALILRGEVAKKSKHTVLEKITPLWSRLSFETKSIIRNISRNKIRSLMGIVGVLGCMLLILAGLGMKDSMNETLVSTYTKTYQYDNKILLNHGEASKESLKLEAAYSQPITEGVLAIKKDGEEKTLNYIVSNQGPYIHLQDKRGEEIEMPKEGLVVSEMVAKDLKVTIGDTVKIKHIGEDWIEGKIGGIATSALAGNVYSSLDYWSDLGFKDIEANGLLVGPEVSVEGLKDLSEVKEVISKASQIDAMAETFESANAIVYILIFAAILLGTTIIYNLGLLNYSEMMRDYATLKVLGFYPSEIRLLSFKENVVLYVIGWLVGIPAGIGFLQVYMNTLSNDTIAFLPKIELTSFIVATLITLVAAIGVNLILSLKINKIDMVMSLKSSE